MDNRKQNALHVIAVTSLLGLTLLCIAWEWFVAPIKPGGSWMVLKAIPLLFMLRGTVKRDLYVMQWSSMAILLYFIEGVVRAVSDTDSLSAGLAGLEIVLTAVYFVCVLRYVGPYKKAARQARLESKDLSQ